MQLVFTKDDYNRWEIREHAQDSQTGVFIMDYDMYYDSIDDICRNITSANPELKGPDLFDAIVVGLTAAGVIVDVEATKLLRDNRPNAVAVLVDEAGDLELLDTVPEGDFVVWSGKYDASNTPYLLSEDEVLYKYMYEPDAPTSDDLEALRYIIRSGFKYYDYDDIYYVEAAKKEARVARYEEQRNTTISLPDEFLLLCEQYGLTPLQAFRDFVADVCGIENYCTSPRTDDYNSNGSDEKGMARAYFDRAHWNPDIEEKYGIGLSRF
jgi:hypothetical protein